MGIVIKTDVLVVGGGAAGIAAAVAAAREGADVILAEKYGFLGGLATAGLIGTICGVFLRNKNPEPIYVNNGFSREFTELLSAKSHSKSILFNQGLHILPYDRWAFIQIANQLITETKNITPVLHCIITNTEVKENLITKVESIVYNQKIILKPSYVVDCSGEAMIVNIAGGITENNHQFNSPAFIFSISGMDDIKDKNDYYISIIREIKRAVQNNLLPKECEKISFIPTSPDEKKIYFKLNLPNLGIQNWNKMTNLEISSRSYAEAILNFLKNNHPNFKNIFICQFGMQVGIRIGQKTLGEKILTKEDILSCKKFNDGIACGSWPIEIWGDKDTPDIQMIPENEYYEIPLGCLIPQKIKNCFVAGRCISAEYEALASARVIGTALSTGYAAGKAAAALSSGKTLEYAINEIRKEQVIRA